jgi:hypothetical protein
MSITYSVIHSRSWSASWDAIADDAEVAGTYASFRSARDAMMHLHFSPLHRCFIGIRVDQSGECIEMTQWEYDDAEAAYYESLDARDARGVWG